MKKILVLAAIASFGISSAAAAWPWTPKVSKPTPPSISAVRG